MTNLIKKPPFEAVKARSVLFWFLLPTCLLVFGTGLVMKFSLLSFLVDELMLLTIDGFLGALVVWMLCYRLSTLGLPFKAFLGPRNYLPSGEAFQICVMNFCLAIGFTLLPHLIAISSGNWLQFNDSALSFRALDTESALGLNLLILMLTVVIAPICEEIVFRGFLLHRFAVKWGLRAAIWVSALIFGLCHGIAPGIFLVGLTFSLVYLKIGGNLRQTIILHAIHNLFVFIFEMVVAGLGVSSVVEHSQGWLIAELLFLTVGGGMFWVFLLAYRQSWQTWPPFVVVDSSELNEPLAQTEHLSSELSL